MKKVYQVNKKGVSGEEEGNDEWIFFHLTNICCCWNVGSYMFIFCPALSTPETIVNHLDGIL